MDLTSREIHFSLSLLTFAVIIIFFVFLTNYPVSSDPVFACLLGLISVVLLFQVYSERVKKPKDSGSRYSIFALICLLVFVIFATFPYYAASAIVAILGIAIIGYCVNYYRLSRQRFYAFLAIAITSTAIISFAVLPGNLNQGWEKGSDETAYEYYASALLLNGTNPYAANMVPALSRFGTLPTVLKNGTIESYYNYPALSLIPGAVAASLGEANTFNLFIFLLVLINVIAAFCVYYKSGFNYLLLLPLAVWIFATYILVAAITAYLAVLFLIFAYILRKYTLAYAILLGLSISTQQLAWIALPFFLILTLKESGRGKFGRVLLVSIAVFLLINGYFIVRSPVHFFNDTVMLYLSSGLPMLGPNIFAISQIASLPLISIAGLAAPVIIIVLFYLYTKRLRLLIGVGPAFLFFLEPRNTPIYALAFVPLIILVCYEALPKKKIASSRGKHL